MAKIVLDLNQFKASGVYTIEFDASERVVINTQTVRLVVGFSRKGPFNAPVFLRDVSESRRVFGTIDSFLESRGSFFHRSLETCLSTGPVFALNLLPLNNVPVNDGGDAVDYRAFSVEAAGTNGDIRRALLSSFFNKERFWYADQTYLQAVVDTKPVDAGSLFNFVNVSQGKRSVIVRKSVNATQYNITARDYYGKNAVPDYIYQFDYLSDYFVDVYIVEGDWSNTATLINDPVYGSYFDSRGLISSRLEQFLSLDDVTLLGSITGCVLPDFVDNNGSNQSINTLVNNATAITGIFCNLNATAFEDYENSVKKLDMVGHSLINSTDDRIDFLSYNTPISSTLGYSFDTSLSSTRQVTSSGDFAPYNKCYPYGGDNGNWFNLLVVPKPAPSDTTFTVTQYTNLRNGLSSNSLIKTFGPTGATDKSSVYANDYVKVDNITDSDSSFTLKLSSPLQSLTATYSTYIDSTNPTAVPSTANVIGATFTSLSAAGGDFILVSGNGYAKYFEVDSSTGGNVTVKSSSFSSGATAAPWFADKWATLGFDADEFDSFVNPSEITVQLYKKGFTAANDLVPDVNADIDYILDPSFAIESVQGARISGFSGAALGTTFTGTGSTYSPIVTLYNVTQGTGIGSAYTWYLGSYTGGYTGAGPTSYNTASGGKYYGVNVLSPGATGYTSGGSWYYGSPLADANAGDVVRVTFSVSGNSFLAVAPDTGTDVVRYQDPNLVQTTLGDLAYIEMYPGAQMYKDIVSKVLVDGDSIRYGSGNSNYNYLGYDTSWGQDDDAYSAVAYGIQGARFKQYTTTTLTTSATTNYVGLNLSYLGTATYTVGGKNALNIYSSLAKNISTDIEIDGQLFGSNLKFNLTSANAANLEVNDFVVNNDINNPHLVRITAKVKKINPSTGVAYFEYTVVEQPKITASGGSNYVTKYTPIQKFIDRFQFSGLNGYTLGAYHLPNNSESQVEKIYGVLDNTNVGSTLADKDVITFRYIVDTFNQGLAPNMGSKQILTRLAKNRQKAMAILNAPSIAEFQASTDPRFTELPDAAAGNPAPVLNTAYIATGGNLSLGPSFTWGLPSEDQGAKFCGVFIPNMILRENNKNISVPPSADVSNNFIRKFITGQPYAIVAGPRRGVISNPKFVKMEYDFLLRDRENLEPVGLNPIVLVKNVGPMIYANQTAYQRTLSAFNNLHVRDLLITVEEAIEDVLTGYLFEFNDVTTRLEISTIVSNYLETVRTAGGVYDYTVVMDESNNTAEIIDQNFGIIDVAIEPSRGLQKFINRVTVLKTGTISSGGFAAV